MQSNNNQNTTPATVADVASMLVSPFDDPHHFDTCDEINDPLDNNNEAVVAVTVPSSKKKRVKKVAAIVILPDKLNVITNDDLKHVFTESSFDVNGNEVETALSLFGYILEDLTTLQLRKVCSLLGVGGYKSQGKVKCCEMIAKEKVREHSYGSKSSFGIINATTLLKHNTLLRIINALFHKDNFDEFASMNQKKSRQELDVGGVGNNKRFLSTLSDYINDEINNDFIGTLVPFSDNEDAADRIIFDGNQYDLNKFEKQNYDKVGASIKELVKKWEGVEKNMKLSGTHLDDPFNFCSKGGFPLYYFYFMVNSNNAEDSLKPKLSSYLREGVFFDSGIKDDNNDKKVASKKRVTSTTHQLTLMNMLMHYVLLQKRKCKYLLIIINKTILFR